MLTVKQYDTKNAIQANLIKNGNPLNLNGCKVYITITGKVYRKECIIADAENGKVYFPLEHRVTEKPGIFNYEFIVEYSDDREEGFPNDGYMKLKVMEEIKE